MMARTIGRALLAMALIAPPAIAAEKQPRTLAPRIMKPLTAWGLDYAEERCTLTRKFGDGDKDVIMRLDSFGNDPLYRIQLIGSVVPAGTYAARHISFHFSNDPGAYTRNRSFWGQVGKDTAAATHFYMLPSALIAQSRKVARESQGKTLLPMPADPSFEAGIRSLTFLFSAQPYELQLGDMAAPLKAMRSCIDDLTASWGLDPAQQHSLRTRPKLKEGRPEVYYPWMASAIGLGAYLPVRIMVDAAGKATDCKVQVDNAPASFVAEACLSLTRESFEPALDAGGNPVPSYYLQSFIFTWDD